MEDEDNLEFDRHETSRSGYMDTQKKHLLFLNLVDLHWINGVDIYRQFWPNSTSGCTEVETERALRVETDTQNGRDRHIHGTYILPFRIESGAANCGRCGNVSRQKNVNYEHQECSGKI